MLRSVPDAHLRRTDLGPSEVGAPGDRCYAPAMASAHLSRAWLVLAGMAFVACGKASPNGDPPPTDDDTGVPGGDTGGSTTDSALPGDAPASKDTGPAPTDGSGVDTRPPPADTSGGPCADDMQCAATDGYCPSAGAPCATLPPQTCSGGSTGSCLGLRPKCKDQACFNSGACNSDADCHAGETCAARGSGGKLCFPTSPCTETVSAADIANGKYAAGKEVCIEDTVPA